MWILNGFDYQTIRIQSVLPVASSQRNHKLLLLLQSGFWFAGWHCDIYCNVSLCRLGSILCKTDCLCMCACWQLDGCSPYLSLTQAHTKSYSSVMCFESNGEWTWTFSLRHSFDSVRRALQLCCTYGWALSQLSLSMLKANQTEKKRQLLMNGIRLWGMFYVVQQRVAFDHHRPTI